MSIDRKLWPQILPPVEIQLEDLRRKKETIRFMIIGKELEIDDLRNKDKLVDAAIAEVEERAKALEG